MNLTIDIGNSAIKAALFGITDCELRMTRIEVDALFNNFPAGVDGAIVVSTRSGEEEVERAVKARVGRFVKFDRTTPVPVRNLYATPETLGYDRLAAAVGAHTLWPDRTMLVVDFGTAITCDLVTATGEYLGGNISPGAASRFRALHDYTGALPLCTLPDGAIEFPSRDTKSAIENGVVEGIVAETEHYIAAVREKFGTAGVIFTGGDAEYFAGRVNFPIFAVSELVLQGLNAILEHNANL